MRYLIIPAILFFLITLIRKKKNKHKFKIRQANRILSKLRSFDNSGAALNYLKKIDPYVFEELVLSALERQSIKIFRNDRYSGDGGIDGRCEINGQLYFIQAKRYPGSIVTKHVVDFERLVTDANCRGLFVHTGTTPKGAKEVKGASSRIDIISGSRLLSLLDLPCAK